LSPPTQQGGSWTETILYSFQGGNDGYFPIGDLVFDKHGDLYGSTWYGGGQGTNCDLYYGGNCGTVFKLSPPSGKSGVWTEQVLHSFGGGKDGATPNGYLALNSAGGVYGLTNSGGNEDCDYGSGQVGCGIAFGLTKHPRGAWNEVILHRFDRSSTDGGNPMAGPIFDLKGNLFGTTLNGGPGPGGIVFRLSPPKGKSGEWKETILHGFSGYNDKGYDPESSLIFDRKGNLYGTTYVSARGALRGDVFKLSSRKSGRWSLDILHGFKGVPDGVLPATGLVFDGAGNLYSTTTSGGTGSCPGGCGTVFEVSPK
jgi:uncharacterized repeat protein (TIGR03803 family)